MLPTAVAHPTMIGPDLGRVLQQVYVHSPADDALLVGKICYSSTIKELVLFCGRNTFLEWNGDKNVDDTI